MFMAPEPTAAAATLVTPVGPPFVPAAEDEAPARQFLLGHGDLFAGGVVTELRGHEFR